MTNIDTNAAFAITATGKAFRVLSDGLYSDKITAVIRELGCNAYDSHVAAGKPNEPFLVNLPSIADPCFSVQDFGLGISDKDIYDIYTKYFTSTKTNNVELVGQLGLGSKSPFSLVREFFVESNFNGEYRKYRMYFDATDTPRVAMVDNKTTTQPNGVKVSFYPTRDDIAHFMYKATTVFKWFTTTPKVMCDGNPVEIENLTTGMKHSGWYKREIRAAYSAEPAYAIMGNIAYPLTANSVKNITSEAKNLLSMPMVIQFDMGAFEISASRESIGYDDRSCENILNRLQQVIEEYYYEIYDNIENASTEWAARVARRNAFNNYNGWGLTLKNIMHNRKFYWKGIEIKSKSIQLDLNTVYGAVHDHGVIRTGETGEQTLHRLKRDSKSSFTQECSEKHVIVFDDIQRNGAARIKHWLSSQEKNKTFSITVFEKPLAGGWKGLEKLLGNPEIVYVSKLPAPPKKDKVSKNEKMMKFKPYRHMGTDTWEAVEHDPKLGGFYIDHNQRRPIDKAGRTVDLVDILNIAKQLGLIPQDTVVYAAKGYLRGKITRTHNWINIVEFLTKKVQDELPTITHALDAIATKNAVNESKYRMGQENWYRMSWDFRDPNSKMKEFISTQLELNRIVAEAGHNHTATKLLELAGELRIPRPQGKADERVARLYAEYKTRYPMLTMRESRTWDNNFKKINEYVDMVDVAWVYFQLTHPVKMEEED